jgi:arylsulfatase A-like enzyme
MSAKAKKALICVFDGLRPDRVTAELTPNLWRFAEGGVWYRESRSVFPSVTRVATTSFATGSKPETHGILNNKVFYPEVMAGRMLDTSSASDLRAAEAYHAGRFIEADGLGCALAKVGKSYAVVHTGSAGSAYLVNHKAAVHGHWTFSIHGHAHTQTPAAVHEVVDRFGPLPDSALPRFGDIDYGADVMVEHVLKKRRPDVALIWFSEPDSSYHFRDIGSADAVAVTRRVDEQFGRILDAVAKGPDGDETVVIAMSDHGQIAIAESVDMHGVLKEVGLPAAEHPGAGVEAVMGLGIGLDITLLDRSDAKLEAAASALMAHPGVGLLFSKSKSEEGGILPGTFPFSAVGIDHPRAADLVCVLRSSTEADQHGLPGQAACTTPIDVPMGGGMHGGLNPHEQNTMLAFGGSTMPALGQIEDPADLTDIVPTILSLLDVPRPASMTGYPLAAVIGERRPALEKRLLRACHATFEQQLTIASGGPRPVVLQGERLRA